MQVLKQSTAASLIVGPILDSTGVEYASAVIGDVSLSKNGATLTALASAATLTYIANGLYTLALTTGNTDTLGRAELFCTKSTYQMPPVRLSVLAAAPFDTLVTNGTLASTTSGRTLVTDASGNASTVLADAVAHGGTPGSSTATLALSQFNATSQTSNTDAFTLAGNGTGAGWKTTGGTTGPGARYIGGATSGDGIDISTTSGHGLFSAASGALKHGIVSNGGSASGSSAAGNGVQFSGGLATSTSGGVAGVGIKANGGGGSATTNVGGTGVLVTAGADNGAGGGSAMTLTHTGSGYDFNATTTPLTIATVTNLTNAPTVGDFTATMKTSIGTAVAASAVASVTAGVTLAANQHVIVDSGTVTTVTTLTNLPAAPTDWLSAAAVSAAAVTKIQVGLSTYAGGDTSGTTTLLTRIPGVVQPQTGDAYAQTNSGTFGLAAIKTAVDLIPTNPYTGTPPTAAAISTQVAADLASAHGAGDWRTADVSALALQSTALAIKARTDNLPNDPADASDVAAAINALAVHGDSVWATANVSGLATTAGTASALAALQTHGDSTWGSGSIDLSALALQATSLAIKAKTDTLGTATVTVTSPVAASGSITLVKGDDYKIADGRSLDWVGASSNVWPDLTGASVTFKVYDGAASYLTTAGSVVTPTGTQHVRAELTSSQTWGLPATGVSFKVLAVLSNGDTITLIEGAATITR